MIKSIFIDVGQILVRVNFKKFVSKISRKSEKNAEEIMRYLESAKLIKLFALGKVGAKEFLYRLKSDLKYEGSISEVRYLWNGMLSPIKNNIKLIKKLRYKYKLIAISNTNILHSRVIYEFGLYNIFYRTILSYKVKKRKPDPVIFKLALKIARSSPKECIYIDDDEKSIRMAKRIGIKSVKINNSSELRKKLIELGISWVTRKGINRY